MFVSLRHIRHPQEPGQRAGGPSKEGGRGGLNSPGDL